MIPTRRSDHVLAIFSLKQTSYLATRITNEEKSSRRFSNNDISMQKQGHFRNCSIVQAKGPSARRGRLPRIHVKRKLSGSLQTQEYKA